MRVTTWDKALTEPVAPERDHIQGPEEAPVTLLEYGDYQCPYCARAYPVVEALQATLAEQMRFAFRHFPLTTVHPFAWGAAEAAEAAGAQGAFWPMHDVLFRDPEHLALPDLLVRGKVLQLDINRFEEDLLTRVYQPRVEADFLSGVRSGVGGTPTFFINGFRYEGQPDFESLLSALRLASTARHG